MRLVSQIIIASNFDKVISDLEAIGSDTDRFVKIVREGNFLVDDVKLAIEKAYVASSDRTIIILAADSYSDVVQNRLLKIIEEPPPNKEFILIFTTKSIILPTIRSRLPIVVIEEIDKEIKIDLNMSNLDIRSVYEFVHSNARTDSTEIKKMIEQIIKKAIQSQKYNLDEKSLKLFENAIKVLDRGSPAPFVLSAVLLKLLARKKK